jgi:uncharacterized protein YyaL (SSP411 family)
MADFLHQNRLNQETSPYLRQHGSNPVHWQPWHDQVLTQAQELNRPLLLSIGYSACHWCHVMAHQCFEDPETAELMNRHFINIKVDREERPDLDTLYQSALGLMGVQGGWPLTIFLTPEGQPFWGGTYFAKEPAYGRPGFDQILTEIARLHDQDPASIASSSQSITEALAQVNTADQPATLPPDILERAAKALEPHMDRQSGGLKGAPKFPQTTLIDLFHFAHLKTKNKINQYTVDLTLTSLCQGGIYDHVAGGFARYSTDDLWLVPHFEKMLYDNALIVKSLTERWRLNRSELFAARIEETIDWLLQDLRLQEGAFYSSLDADSDGAEGKYYTWDYDHIKDVLKTDFEPLEEHYDVTPEGNWKGATILNRLQSRQWLGPEREGRLRQSLDTLRQARSSRIKPERDDKILTDWNGLTITALTEAAMAFSKSKWLEAAKQAFAFITTHVADGEELYHTWARGRAHIGAFSDDYANMSQAALTLFEATGNSAYLDHAVTWTEVLHRHFRDPDTGGYFFTHGESASLLHRICQAADHPLPSANGTMGQVLTKLGYLCGQEKYHQRAANLFAAFAKVAGRQPLAHATLLTSYDFFLEPTQIVLAGDPDLALTQALQAEVFRAPVRHRIFHLVSDTASLPPTHPAHGKQRQEGQPTLYVCRGQTCSLPITDPAQVRALF